MHRLPGFFVKDQTLHAIQRGNNRGVIFAAPGDYVRVTDFLLDAAKR